MSYLSSVLNSISKGESATTSQSPRPTFSSKPSIPSVSTAGIKRKAEAELLDTQNKSQRILNGKSPRDIKPLHARPRENVTGPGTKYSGPQRSSNGVAADGVKADRPASNSTPSKVNNANTAPKLTSAKIVPVKPASLQAASRPVSATKAGSSTPGSASTSQAPPQPKKGSFKDLMARAKAAQTVAVGKITHKPSERLEKLGKRERQALAQGKPIRGKPPLTSQPNPAKATIAKDGKKPVNSAGSASGPKYQGTSKPKVTPRPAYAGTAKPSASSKSTYKGTSKAGDKPGSTHTVKSARRADRNEYLGTDEEDEGEYGYDSEGQYTEASEDFSDMDAGFDEIGEEEEEAERQARKDDIKEQRQLEKLAREKADRKKRLGY